VTKDKTQAELLRLVELDYEKTTKLTEGTISSGFTIRGWAITLTSALIGLAFQARLWQVAMLAAFLVLLFALVDGYHSWLYARALKQTASIEGILSAYFARLARGKDDPDATSEFEAALLAHQFGRFSQTQQFTLRSLWEARPKAVLLPLYAALLCGALVGAGLVAYLTQGPGAKLDCVRVPGQTELFRCTPKPGA
jgi:hypothetical protein